MDRLHDLARAGVRELQETYREFRGERGKTSRDREGADTMVVDRSFIQTVSRLLHGRGSLSACVAGVLVCLLAGVGVSAEPVRGLEAVQDNLPWFDSENNYEVYDNELRGKRQNGTTAVTSLGRPPMSEPMSLLLSRSRYFAEDGHLDVVLRFDMPLEQTPQGSLHVQLVDADGQVVSEQTIAQIPGSQVFFSYQFDDAMAGRQGELRVAWQRDGQPVVQAAAAFRVEQAQPTKRSGRVSLTIPNDSQAVVAGAPMTVGVPFPRGVLRDLDQVRLVDEQGSELPLQVRETARWSRFGSIRWILCDFTADLNGQPRQLFLEYGPQISRAAHDAIDVQTRGDAFPHIQAGRLRIDDAGIAYDLVGDGTFTHLVDAAALTGAFVERVDGVNYVGWGHHFVSTTGDIYTLSEPGFEVEQIGPEKVVLRSEGWYVNQRTGQRFCQFVNRYVVHRNSPVVRLFHTWIFTGDSNRERIRNMGWRFPMVGMEPIGFLTSFDGRDPWREGYYLRQHDHDEFALFEYKEPNRSARIRDDMDPSRPISQIATGRRATGVMGMRNDAGSVYLGVKDFWQNFPNSMAFEDGAMTFYQWPKYGRPRQHPISSDDMTDIWRLWFAHEGETMSLSLPVELTEGPIYIAEAGPEPHFAYGRPDSINAQGLAKTAEMWLYLTGPETSSQQAARVLEGLNNETLRAVVDPQWLTASGAFYEIRHRDEENFPELEQVYDQIVRSPMQQVERMGVYGKWVYGDLLRSANLDEQTASLYRTFRKAHWGWPFSWLPFVRSGETDVLRFAQAATRMMTDVAFCHYVSEDMRNHFASLPTRRMWDEKQPFREIGWHNRNLIPWGGYWGPTTRLYVDEAEWLWHAWYLTGYDRARDVALKWAEQTKIEHPDKLGRGPITAGWNRSRWPVNLQKQYLEMYEATFDPWFLTAAHAIADMHVHRHQQEGWEGHPWNTGPREFQRYTDDQGEHRAFYLAFADNMADWQNRGWATTPSTLIPSAVHAWRMTGDMYYLRRAAGLLDVAKWSTYMGDEFPYYQGFYTRGASDPHMLQTSWYQKWWGLVIAAMHDAGGMPEHPLPLVYRQHLTANTVIAVRKQADEPVTLRVAGRFGIVGPDGQLMMEGDEPEVTLPADAPQGTYRVTLGRRVVTLPLTPPGTPEVLLPHSGQPVGMGEDLTQHWFYVPTGVESFRITFQNAEPFRQFLRLNTIWNPDGQVAWQWHQRAADYDPQQETVVAQVTVSPQHAGRLWRITLPGSRSMPFTLDPQLPGVLAHSPDRWFEP